jgi:hypothetical protein
MEFAINTAIAFDSGKNLLVMSLMLIRGVDRGQNDDGS